MIAPEIVLACQWLFMAYMACYGVMQLLLISSAVRWLRGYEDALDYELEGVEPSGHEPSVSIISPAYNEEKSVTAAVNSLFELNYPDFEVIVVNDGSKDQTLDVLINHFQLYKKKDTSDPQLPHAPVVAVYHSKKEPRLRVIDKANAGKADALNCGISYSRNALVCNIDADTLLERDSLYRLVRPFMADRSVIAAGGLIRIANGCIIKDGRLASIRLPSNSIVILQIIEYLRAFLFGRIGWNHSNSVLVISGAFGLFSRRAIREVGGYSVKTIGEDMELVVRLHRKFSENNEPYRILFLPDPVAWTEVPEDVVSLRNQRIRWQRGLGESLSMNLRLMFSRNGGVVGWLAFPYLLVFEFFGPVFEILGFILLFLALSYGLLNPLAAVSFLLMSVGITLLMSSTAMAAYQMSFHRFVTIKTFPVLALAIFFEGLLLRPINNFWRSIGVFLWLIKAPAKWGHITRRGVAATVRDT